MRRRGPQIPIAPFQHWCAEQVALTSKSRPWNGAACIYGPSSEVADLLGIHVRALNRVIRGVYAGMQNGHKAEFPVDTISRYYVEDALTHAGVDFYELYPALEAERDIELEPDEWCDRCGEDVTPIGGQCPWCDLMLGDVAA